MAKQARHKAEDVGARSADDLATRFAALPPRGASEMSKVESDFAGFWLELTNEQVTHNLETFRSLAVTRDWREALEIQNAFARDSLARMAEGASRYLEIASDTTAPLFATGEDEARKAA